MIAPQIAQAAEARAGLSYSSDRKAYAAWLFPTDTPAQADEMASSLYACLLHVRACLREVGLDGTCHYRGALVDVLREPYALHLGDIGPMLVTLARERGWYSSAEADLLDLQAGDAVIVGTGTSTHGLVVTGFDGSTIYSVDGGQTDAGNHFRGTAILACKRPLWRRDVPGVYLGDRRVQCRIRL